MRSACFPSAWAWWTSLLPLSTSLVPSALKTGSIGIPWTSSAALYSIEKQNFRLECSVNWFSKSPSTISFGEIEIAKQGITLPGYSLILKISSLTWMAQTSGIMNVEYLALSMVCNSNPGMKTQDGTVQWPKIVFWGNAMNEAQVNNKAYPRPK